jgi:hypothetical protein
MKKPMCLAALALMLAGANMRADEKPVDALGWLVGGVWTADTTKMGNGMLRIETRYQWSDNHSFVRFNTHFVSDKGEAKTYDGQFFWNPARKSHAMWYMDAKNNIIEGPVEISGDVMSMTFRAKNFEGKDADLRVDVTRKNNDSYHWALMEKQGAEWKELAALDYIRKQAKLVRPASVSRWDKSSGRTFFNDHTYPWHQHVHHSSLRADTRLSQDSQDRSRGHVSWGQDPRSIPLA